MDYKFLGTEAQNEPTVQKYLNKSNNDVDLMKGFRVYMDALKAGGSSIQKDFGSSDGGQQAAERGAYIDGVKALSKVLGLARVIPMSSDTMNLGVLTSDDELFTISEGGLTSPRSTGSINDRVLNATLLGASKRYSLKWLSNGPFATVGEALSFVQASQFRAVVNGISKLALLGTGSAGFIGRLSGDGWIGQANLGNAGALQTVLPVTASVGAFTSGEVTSSVEDLISRIDQEYTENFQTTEKDLLVSPKVFEAIRLQNKGTVLSNAQFLATPNQFEQGQHTIHKIAHLQASESIMLSAQKGNLVAGIGMGEGSFSPRFAVKWFEEFDAFEIFHKIDFDVQVPEISGSIVGLIVTA